MNLEQTLLTHAVDGLIAFVAIEALALWVWRRATGRGLRPAAFLPNLLAGALLMLALRFALTPGQLPAALACMAGAGLSHWVDLRGRAARAERR